MPLRLNPPTFFGLATAILLLATAWFAVNRSPLVTIPPFGPPSLAWPDDSFRDGAYFADPAEIPAPLTTRGSRISGSEFRGAFTSGWFEARPQVAFLVSGFPATPGNALSLEVRLASGHTHTLAFTQVDPRESWRPWLVSLPPHAAAFRVLAVDHTTAHEGWLAFTEPFEPSFRPALWSQVARTLFAFIFQLLLLATLGLACTAVAGSFLARTLGSDEDLLVPLVASAAVALLGYLAFWTYFAHPLAGKLLSWTLPLAASGILLLHRHDTATRTCQLARPFAVLAAIGLLYLALLVLFEPSRLSFLAAHRFVEGLPSDNEIPRAFAERLWKGDSPRQLWADWLSSDRPPLQSGWLLLTWPILHGFGLDLDTTAATSGLCFQLLWVFAAAAFAQHLGASLGQALALAAAVAFTGVLLLFSVFVWPKLAAAALVIAAYLLWFQHPFGTSRPSARRLALGGVCAALGWLSHGGVAFALLGLAPVALLHRARLPLGRWLIALAAFTLTAVPWLAYQRWYEPPGNRLLKMHLAGAPEVDSRTTTQALRDGYREIGWRGALAARTANLAQQFSGDWSRFWRFDLLEQPQTLRRDETSFTLRACGLWLLAAPALLARVVRRRRSPRPSSPAPAYTRVRHALLWLLATTVTWIALMFDPHTTTIHQGPLVTPLLLLTLLAFASLRAHPRFFATLAALQSAWFLIAWSIPTPGTAGSLQLVPAALATLSTLALATTFLAAAVFLLAKSTRSLRSPLS